MKLFGWVDFSCLQVGCARVNIQSSEPNINEHAGTPTQMSDLLIPVRLIVQTASKIFELAQLVLTTSASAVVQRVVERNASKNLRPCGNPRKGRMRS
jgi:hypothetical protein